VQASKFQAHKLKLDRYSPLLIIAIVGIIFVFYCWLNYPTSDDFFSDSEHKVRVLISQVPLDKSIRFTVAGPFKIFAGSKHFNYNDPYSMIHETASLKAEISFSSKDGLLINKTPTGLKELMITPKKPGSFKLGAVVYRGQFLLEKTKGDSIQLINIVDLEHYLAGVLFKEMPSAFHDEALKAQCVACRSYAIYRMKNSENKKYLTDDERSQVYGGMTAETKRSHAIVKDTLGRILTYEDEVKEKKTTKILPAYFSSTCGGRTSSASDAFTGDAPGPVNSSHICGYCDNSPTHSWTTILKREELITQLGLAQDIDDFDLQVTSMNPAHRAKEISLIDKKRAVIKKYSAKDFRNLLNHKKPLKEQILSTMIVNIKRENNRYIFSGKGWGHGVGLCQYGAQGLGKAGKAYTQILEYYYPGANLLTNYGNKQ